jgi:hypothetical protein
MLLRFVLSWLISLSLPVKVSVLSGKLFVFQTLSVQADKLIEEGDGVKNKTVS